MIEEGSLQKKKREMKNGSYSTTFTRPLEFFPVLTLENVSAVFVNT